MSDYPQMTPEEILKFFVESSTVSTFRSREEEDMFFVDLVNDLIDTIPLEERLLPPNFYPQLSSVEFFSIFLSPAPDSIHP